MDNFILIIKDYTFQTVALGSALLGIISGLLGSFLILRKQSLLGDGISHAALPGVVIAFIITGNKNTEVLLLGALVWGLISIFLINTIVKTSRLSFDTALALIMSIFFGLGMVFLTYVQKFPTANQAGLRRFIYGQASTMLIRDVHIMVICVIILLFIVLLLWKEFKVFIFDASYAASQGFGTKRMNFILSLLLVIGIIIGLQTVGVVLMSAMLITPAVAARQWTNKLWVMSTLSALFGAISGIVGTTISAIIPKMPTGPIIILIVSVIAMFSLLFAPNRGVIYKIYKRQCNKALLKL